MRASRAVSCANQILHVHFKLTNHIIIRDDLKSISFSYVGSAKITSFLFDGKKKNMNYLLSFFSSVELIDRLYE